MCGRLFRKKEQSETSVFILPSKHLEHCDFINKHLAPPSGHPQGK